MLARNRPLPITIKEHQSTSRQCSMQVKPGYKLLLVIAATSFQISLARDVI
jgi:hypothetical protein